MLSRRRRDFNSPVDRFKDGPDGVRIEKFESGVPRLGVTFQQVGHICVEIMDMGIDPSTLAAAAGGGGGIPNVEEVQAQAEAQRQMEEQRASILDQILEPAAKDRMNRLKLVKKEKARAVEDSLIKAATSGQLRTKVSEEELIGMLDGVSGGSSGGEGGENSSKKGVSIQRRNYGMDSDDDDNDDDLL